MASTVKKDYYAWEGFCACLNAGFDADGAIVPLKASDVTAFCDMKPNTYPVELRISDGISSEYVTFTGCVDGVPQFERGNCPQAWPAGSSVCFAWTPANIRAIVCCDGLSDDAVFAMCVKLQEFDTKGFDIEGCSVQEVIEQIVCALKCVKDLIPTIEAICETIDEKIAAYAVIVSGLLATLQANLQADIDTKLNKAQVQTCIDAAIANIVFPAPFELPAGELGDVLYHNGITWTTLDLKATIAACINARFSEADGILFIDANGDGDASFCVEPCATDPANLPPSCPPQQEIVCTTGDAFTHTIPAATDPEGGVLTIAAPDIPAGVTAVLQTDGSVIVSGTCPTAGGYAFTVDYSDPEGAMCSVAVILTSGEGGGGPTEISGGTLPDKTLEFGTADLCDAASCFSNGSGTKTYTVSSVAPITGLTVDSSGVVSIPNNVPVGTYVITVNASDDTGDADCTFNLEVEAAGGITGIINVGCENTGPPVEPIPYCGIGDAGGILNNTTGETICGYQIREFAYSDTAGLVMILESATPLTQSSVTSVSLDGGTTVDLTSAANFTSLGGNLYQWVWTPVAANNEISGGSPTMQITYVCG